MTISGQYTTAEIFTENIEDAALQWVREQCDQPVLNTKSRKPIAEFS